MKNKKKVLTDTKTKAMSERRGSEQDVLCENGAAYFAAVMQIAVPVALQAMLQSSFSMIDQVMVGQLGSESIAAVEIAGKPGFILTFVAGAVAAIAGIMVSQYMGKKDSRAVSRSMSVNLVLTVLIAVCFSTLCMAVPGRICGIYVSDEKVTDIAASYLRIIAAAYLPMCVSTILAVRVRCMDHASYPLYVSILCALVNTGLNWILIFGRLGCPRLGVQGAAIASVISQMAGMILMILIYLRIVGHIHFSLSLGKEGFRQYLFMLLPVVLNEFLWSVGQNINTYIYGHLSTKELAAMSLTGPVQGMLIGALSGIAQAAGILVGKRLGEEAYEEGYRESRLLCLYGLAGAVILSAALVILRTPYTRIFHVETDVRQTAGQLLLAFAVLAPVKVENMILGGGIVRSGGKTTYIMAVDMIGTWLIGVPLGLWAGLLLHLPVVWVYFILSQEELVRLVITLIIFRRKTWMRTL